jgi:hypothetical protein
MISYSGWGLCLMASVLAVAAALWAQSTNPAGDGATTKASTQPAYPSAIPPKIYSLKEMPRVDTHVHIRKAVDIQRLVNAMDDAGITISIDLSGGHEFADKMEESAKTCKGRILVAPSQGNAGAKLWWTMDDLDRFAKAGCAGLKVHCHYTRGINSEENIAKFRHQGELDLPVLGFHIADPPEGSYLKPGREECIADAIQVIESCPNTTFIMAHGFWLMNNDKDLDQLGGFFDRFPNLFVDLSAVDQWWDRPDPSPAKLREFVLKYQDRLLFATDGSPGYNTKKNYENSYHVYESDDENIKDGFFPGEKDKTTIQGLNLPLETLNRIYWWNAARTIPRVRETLKNLGYVVEAEPAK